MLILELIDAGFTGFVARRNDFIERGDGVAGAQVARVLRIVVEVARAKLAVLVSDETVRTDDRRIELDLDLDVPGDRGDRDMGRPGFGDQDALGFAERVQIGIVAVPLVSQPLHRRILQVVVPSAEHRQRDAGVAL